MLQSPELLRYFLGLVVFVAAVVRGPPGCERKRVPLSPFPHPPATNTPRPKNQTKPPPDTTQIYPVGRAIGRQGGRNSSLLPSR